MAWTSPKTWSVAEKVTAALMNTHLRDNLLWLRGVLDGTGSDDVTVPAELRIENDANFKLLKASSTLPAVQFDTGGDSHYYDRTANTHNLEVGGTAVLTVDADGKLSGNGFVESAEYTITNGSTQNIAHGLPATPRVVIGRYGTATGDSGRTRALVNSYVAVTSGARISEWGATNIVVINNTGATIYVKVWAQI